MNWISRQSVVWGWLVLGVSLGVGTVAWAQIEVPTVQPSKEQLTQIVTIKGDLHPFYAVTLKARVTGTVAQINYEAGDLVKKGGAPIAVLSVPDLEAGLARAEAGVSAAVAQVKDAEATVEIAQSQLVICHSMVLVEEAKLVVRKAGRVIREIIARRSKNLLEKRAATPAEVEESAAELESARAMEESAKANVAVAQAQTGAAEAQLSAANSGVEKARAFHNMAKATRKEAQTMLSFARIESPFDEAVVSMRHVDPGALIREDESPIVDLMDLHRVRCRFDVPEEVATRVAKGTKITLRIATDRSNPIVTTITRVMSHFNMKTRTRGAEVELDNPGGRLLPGMFVYVDLEFRSAKGSFTLPGEVIIRGRGAPHVLLAENGKVVRRDVTLGVQSVKFLPNSNKTKLLIEIAAGLDGDESVITKGLAGLRVGEAVKVMGN